MTLIIIKISHFCEILLSFNEDDYIKKSDQLYSFVISFLSYCIKLIQLNDDNVVHFSLHILYEYFMWKQIYYTVILYSNRVFLWIDSISKKTVRVFAQSSLILPQTGHSDAHVPGSCTSV